MGSTGDTANLAADNAAADRTDEIADRTDDIADLSDGVADLSDEIADLTDFITPCAPCAARESAARPPAGPAPWPALCDAVQALARRNASCSRAAAKLARQNARCFRAAAKLSRQHGDAYLTVAPAAPDPAAEPAGLHLTAWRRPWEGSGMFHVVAQGPRGRYVQWYDFGAPGGQVRILKSPSEDSFGHAVGILDETAVRVGNRDGGLDPAAVRAASGSLLEFFERAAAEALLPKEQTPAALDAGFDRRGRAPAPRPKIPDGVLRRNDTSFPVRATAKLRDLYGAYLRAQRDAADPAHGWASILKYYQYLVRAVMSDPEFGIGADGNARGLLIYHTMGMGKTRLAVATAMSMWDVRPPVVLLARGLQKNFRETVEAVVEGLYADAPGVDAGGLARLKAEAVARFTFVSMDAYNAADQMARAGTGAKRVKRGDLAGATGGLDGKLLIVDEAHNFFRAIINSSAENANGRRLYDMVMTARNLRILFLTGTPPAKNPFELVPCFNMLAGADLLPTQYETFYKLYVDVGRRAVRNRAHLANRLAGLVSHVTHARPSEPAGDQARVDKQPRDDGWFPAEKPVIVETVEMGADQYRTYLLAREKEEAEGRGGEGAGGRGAGSLTSPPLALPGSEKKAMRSYYVKSRSLGNFAAPREWAGSPVDAMPAEVFTPAVGPKLALIAERADKAPGPVLVYSQFVDAGGLRPLGRFLQRLGYAPYVPGPAEVAAAAARPPGRAKRAEAEAEADADAAPPEPRDADAAGPRGAESILAHVVDAPRAVGGGAQATLLPLAEASPAQLAELAALGSDPEVYGGIGAGRPWDAAYVGRLHAQASKEAPARSGYYHWLVLAPPGPAVAGYVGFRPPPGGVKGPRGGDTQMRYFVAPARRGQGLATAAGRLAVEALARDAPRNPYVWAFIDPANAGSIRVAEKLGFARVGAARVGGHPVEAYRRRAAGAAPGAEAPRRKKKAQKGPDRRAEAAAAGDRDVPADFPFRRGFLPPLGEMYGRLEAIADRPPAEWAAAGAATQRLALVRRTFPADFDAADGLTDLFVEPVRVACRERGEPSPAAAWREVKARAAAEGRALPAGARERRELVYAAARGCNLFNNALAVYLLARFGARDVLDCTAGWGDRLVAAHVAGARTYRGWDTNPALQPVYAAIGEALGVLRVPGEPGGPPLAWAVEPGEGALDWAVELGQFEAAAPRFAAGGDMAERFDTALFCPPYFDKEVYQGPGTSSEAHPTSDRWYREFYRPAVGAAARGLRAGGHLLAYATDGMMRTSIADVLARLEKAGGPEFRYLGAVGFQQVVELPGQAPREGRVRDTFVWQRAPAAEGPSEGSAASRGAGRAVGEAPGVVRTPAGPGGFFSRAGVAAETDSLYLFGENDEQKGGDAVPRSTQAVIRGLPNAVGIRTCYRPGVGYDDSTLAANERHFAEDFAEALAALDSGLGGRAYRRVVIPGDGLGTGVAALDSNPAAAETWKALGEAEAKFVQSAAAALRRPPAFGGLVIPVGPTDRPSRTFSLNEREYDVEKLWGLTDGLPVVDRDTAGLEWLLAEPVWTEPGGPDLSPRGVLDAMDAHPAHAAAIRGADMAHPLLLVAREHPDERGDEFVVDGMHRLCRAVLERQGRVRARVIPPEIMQEALLVAGGHPGRTGGLIVAEYLGPARGFRNVRIVPRRALRAKEGGAGAAKGHYAVISGEVPSEVRDAIKLAFNAPANAHGGVIKAILVSKTGAEGLDLKYIRETHQLEPYWDKARDEQVKSRAVRIGSHDGLPREEREVQPYLYVAAANKKIWDQMLARDREAKTIDEQFAERATERFETNNAFRALLAEVCLECALFGYGACRACIPTGAPLFHDDPALDARLPDPCEVRRESAVKASSVLVGGVTYYYTADPASPLGYTFYALREDLGGYAPLDPSDPLVPELLRAIGQAGPAKPEPPAAEAETPAEGATGGRKPKPGDPLDCLDADGLEAFAAAAGWCELEPSDCAGL